MTFHDLLLVSNETTNLACFTVNTILFVYLFCLGFFVFFSVWMSHGKRVFPAVSVLQWTPFPAIPSFNVIVHIKQGAVQLSIKLSTRSKTLKSALGRENSECAHEFDESGGSWKLYAILSHPLWVYSVLLDLCYVRLCQIERFCGKISSSVHRLATNPCAGHWNVQGKVSQ